MKVEKGVILKKTSTRKTQIKLTMIEDVSLYSYFTWIFKFYTTQDLTTSRNAIMVKVEFRYFEMSLTLKVFKKTQRATVFRLTCIIR